MALNLKDNQFSGELYENSCIWDSVVSCFSQINLNNMKMMPGRDNYENVWPVLYHVINEQLGSKGRIKQRVCDFGCGTGNFAEKLCQMKLSTYACDISEKMIAEARMLTQGDVVYEIGNLDFIQKYSPFKLITAIMVFQFVEDIRQTAKVIAQCLEEDGVLFFAIHNIEYVHECVKHGVKFCGITDKEKTEKGKILIGTRWIETYIRSPEWYDKMLIEEGMIRVGYSLNSNKPPQEIDEEGQVNWNSLKYYIAWYKKKN